jgi:methyl-accepting chemotaxis protein
MMQGMRWTVGRRIAALALFLFLALGCVGMVGFQQSTGSADAVGVAFSVSSALSTTVDTQHTAAVVLADAYKLAEGLSADDRKATIEQSDEHAAELRQDLDALRAADLPQTRAAMGTFAPKAEAVLAHATAFGGLTRVPSATQVAQVQRDWQAFDDAADALREELTKESAALRALAEAGARRAVLLIVVSVLVAIPLTGAAMWFIVRALAGPVRQTQQVLEGVAAGDFTRRVPVHRRDDLGRMAEAVNATVERVGAALGRIRQEAAELVTASRQLGGVSEQVSVGARELTAEAASVSGSAEHVSGDIQSVAGGSEQMRASIGEITRNATEATQIVSEAVRLAGSANVIMEKLDASSAEIEEVARVITSIADQTNLLALNATIEAARAGEAGKGFAVVASEVKDLAQETGRATQSIGSRIGTIQADSADAVAALQQISATIHRIQEIQQSIAGAMEEQSASTSEIGTSVHRIAGSAADIAQRIGTVTRASEAAAAAAGDAREAADRVAGTASTLQDIVGQFRIEPAATS